MSVFARAAARNGPALLAWMGAFFLAMDLMGGGMKASFKTTLQSYLAEHGNDFNELVSFVIGLLVTGIIQSSSTVTSMVVVMASEGIIPLVIAIGIIHGANLGTSVTSSLVAFAAETRPLTGHPVRDLVNLFTAPRLPGFHRAVSTAIVHGLFNIVLVTTLLVTIEIPFQGILRLSTAAAEAVDDSLAGADVVLTLMAWLSPSTYTKPVVEALLGLGIPGWSLVPAGLALLFAALKGFAGSMRAVLMADTDLNDLGAVGRRLIGNRPIDTFLRGFILTVLVQSSSATTSLVVPLAAMGLFDVRRIFPFIMGANIGTCFTALIAAGSKVGEAGFELGLTAAFAHLLLNTLAVVIVGIVPGVQTSVLRWSVWIANASVAFPGTLVAYLLTLVFVVPAVVYSLPYQVSWVLFVAVIAVLLFGPHVFFRQLTLDRVVEVDLGEETGSGQGVAQPARA